MSTKSSVIVKKFGDVKSIKIEPHPLPSLDGRIEVQVHYCGMNFSDLYMRLGFLTKELPLVLGSECTGVIKNMGIKANSLKIGQRVICYNYLGGMYSDIIRVPPEQIFPLPDDVPFDVGACIFVNYLTAYFALCELGSLKPNSSILINSCAGGVGWAATQLAVNIGNVKIYGTTSKQKEEQVKKNGVTKIFNYNTLAEELKKEEPQGVDIIIENQAGNSLYDNMNLLKPLGRTVLTGVNIAINKDKLSYLSLLKMWWRSWWFDLKNLVMHNQIIAGLHLGTLLEKDREKVVTSLNHIFDLLREKKIQPRIDSVWPIEAYSEATKKLSERQNIGKVLIQIR